MALVAHADVGDRVLVHAGPAINVIAEHEARETLALFAQLRELDVAERAKEDEG